MYCRNRILRKLKEKKPVYSILLYRVNLIIGIIGIIFYDMYLISYLKGDTQIKYFYLLGILLVAAFFLSFSKKFINYIDEIYYIISFGATVWLIYINVVLKFNNIFLCSLVAGFFIMIEIISNRKMLYFYYFTIMPLSIGACYFSNGGYAMVSVVIVVFLFLGLIAFFSVYERITLIQVYEEALYTDTLTGLLNRLAIKKLLNQMSQNDKLGFSIIYINIDNFKEINNTFGEKTGDDVLKRLSRDIEKNIAPDSVLGRLCSDQFILILPKVHDAEKANNIYNDIVDKIEFNLPQLNFKYSLSAGIAIYDKGMNKIEDLVISAEKASNIAKQIEENSVSVWAESNIAHEQYNKKIINAIRFKSETSIINFYQPIMSRNGEITRFEALSRMQIEPDKIIQPGRFIPLAEDKGLIEIVDYRAAEQAFKFIRRCKDELNFSPFISINVSAIIFNNKYFQKLVELKEKYKVEPFYITVEITESVLINNYKYANQIIGQLKNEGFLIALDDFGTGFSSLSYLKNMKFDIFKLDKSLIDDVNKKNIDIVEYIVKLGKLLNMKVVIEGIEQPIQMDLLANTGCDYYQGYLISKPISAEETFEMIRKHAHIIKSSLKNA